MNFQRIAADLLNSFRAAGVPSPQSPAAGLDDLECLDSGSEFEKSADGNPLDRMKHIWFEIVERPAGGAPWRGFRVVKVSELKYLPQEARADPSLIRKQASLMRGLYAAGVEALTLHYGVFDPPLGIVQCYGAAGRHETLPGAIAIAERGHAAVIASMTAQYAQSRFAPLTIERGLWLAEALKNMPRVTALVGQPDPREGARGGGQQQTSGGGAGAGPKGAASGFSEQQNEILFRALARAREEFLFINIATPIRRRDLAAMLESLADLTSPIASRQQGATSIGFGVSLPVILSIGQAETAGQSYGTAQGQGVSEGIGVSRGTAHTEGVADSSGWSHSNSVGHAEGSAVTDSVSHTSGVTRSTSVSQGTSESFGASQAHSESQTNSIADTTGSSHSNSVFGSSSVGGSHSESSGSTYGETLPGVSGNLGLSGGIPADTLTGRGGVTFGITPAVSHGSYSGVSDGSSWASTSGSGESWGTSQAHTVGQATTVGDSVGQNHSVGVSQSTGESAGSFQSDSVGQANSHSQSDSTGESWGESGSHTVSSADTVSQAQSSSLGRSYTQAVSLGRNIGAAQMTGLGAGVAPSASISKSFQWKDEAAIALTQLLEEQLNILREAGEEGGFYSDVYILNRTANGQSIAEAAAVQAFGGSQGVVTHLQARRPAGPAEARHLGRHIRAFTPSTLTESLGWLNGYAYSTVVTPTQQAAYSAPGLFEEGTALTIQERTPPFAFVPDMRGEAVLGFLYSTERGELTNAPVRINEGRHFHTLFSADTGFGKTVAAERLAVEAVNQWHHRVVVLDFGAGWRRLANGPLPVERVDLYQLFPGAVRPFRWNFLQIGRRIDPNRQHAATAELIANAGRMGPRQIGYLKKALWALYIEQGVMATEKDVYTDPRWGQVDPSASSGQVGGELAALLQAQADRRRAGRARAGLSVLDLEPFERQALAVHRSRPVNISGLYAKMKDLYDSLPKGDQVGRTSLDGILIRLEPFTHGELALMYGGIGATLPIEDLGLLGPEENPADRWGLCVLEGGAEMDEYGKSVILSLAAWHLYNDSIVRRRETVGGFSGPRGEVPEQMRRGGAGANNRPLDIFFEEANKILSGAASTIGSDTTGTSSRAAAIELWQTMWRDGRKYSIYLHPVVQTLSELPPGIQASCNTSFFGQMKGLADRDLAIGHIARSERGFVDEEYKRYMSRIPKALAVVKFGYSEDVADMEPMLMRPLRVPAQEPDDAEIIERFGVLPMKR